MLRGCVGLEVVSFGVAGLHQGLSLLKCPFHILSPSHTPPPTLGRTRYLVEMLF